MEASIYEESEVVKHYLACGRMDKTRVHFHIGPQLLKDILARNNIFPSMRKNSLNVEYFKEIDSAEKAYWLGYIAADGCIKKCGYKLSFCIKSTDSEILSSFKEAVKSGSPVSTRDVLDKRTNKVYSSSSLQICSKEFCQYIKSHGVDENKSSVFNFPKIREEFYSHFIRGLYDGDGSIHVKKSKVKKQITFRVNLITSSSAANFIKNYLTSIGVLSQKIFAKPSEGIYYLNFMKTAHEFLKWIYKDSTKETRLSRKYKKYTENLPALLDKERKIKNTETGETFTFTSLTAFCREKLLNPTYMQNILSGFHPKPKNGKHSMWEEII